MYIVFTFIKHSCFCTIWYVGNVTLILPVNLQIVALLVRVLFYHRQGRSTIQLCRVKGAAKHQKKKENLTNLSKFQLLQVQILRLVPHSGMHLLITETLILQMVPLYLNCDKRWVQLIIRKQMCLIKICCYFQIGSLLVKCTYGRKTCKYM